MRTTIDLLEDLINEAMKIIKAITKIEIIKMAFYNKNQKYKIKSLKNYKGKLKLDIDLNVLRARNENIS